MILLQESQFTIGLGTLVAIILAIISAFIVFIWIHFKEIGKLKDDINAIKNLNEKQTHKIEKLESQVSYHEKVINYFTTMMFDLGKQKLNEKNNPEK
jgi:hypothetical protein